MSGALARVTCPTVAAFLAIQSLSASASFGSSTFLAEGTKLTWGALNNMTSDACWMAKDLVGNLAVVWRLDEKLDVFNAPKENDDSPIMFHLVCNLRNGIRIFISQGQPTENTSKEANNPSTQYLHSHGYLQQFFLNEDSLLAWVVMSKKCSWSWEIVIGTPLAWFKKAKLLRP